MTLAERTVKALRENLDPPLELTAEGDNVFIMREAKVEMSKFDEPDLAVLAVVSEVQDRVMRFGGSPWPDGEASIPDVENLWVHIGERSFQV